MLDFPRDNLAQCIRGIWGGRIRGGEYREVVNAWSEKSRVPARTGSLGGISGGVVLDGSDRLLEWFRRNRDAGVES
jgi:hypothetical protein